MLRRSAQPRRGATEYWVRSPTLPRRHLLNITRTSAGYGAPIASASGTPKARCYRELLTATIIYAVDYTIVSHYTYTEHFPGRQKRSRITGFATRAIRPGGSKILFAERSERAHVHSTAKHSMAWHGTKWQVETNRPTPRTPSNGCECKPHACPPTPSHSSPPGARQLPVWP